MESTILALPLCMLHAHVLAVLRRHGMIRIRCICASCSCCVHMYRLCQLRCHALPPASTPASSCCSARVGSILWAFLFLFFACACTCGASGARACCGFQVFMIFVFVVLAAQRRSVSPMSQCPVGQHSCCIFVWCISCAHVFAVLQAPGHEMSAVLCARCGSGHSELAAYFWQFCLLVLWQHWLTANNARVFGR